MCNLLEFSVSNQRKTFSHSLIFLAIKATVEFLIRSDFLKHLTIKNCDKILLKISFRNFKSYETNTPINSKLQHPPPPQAYPGHLTVHRALGRGHLNIAWEGWGI